MRHFFLSIFLFVGAILMSSPSSAADLSTADSAAIHAIIDHETDAWNRHDMDAFVADMAPDVDWVNIVGMHWQGRDTVRNAHFGMHKSPMFKDSHMSPPKTVDIRPLAPDVALVVTTSDPLQGVGPTPDGGTYPPGGYIFTLVMVKTDGAWRVVHGHNTIISPQAAKHDLTKPAS